ncbi:hypothetical protein BDF20DRAFT_868430 [Mycotypha africana]|uniref:uncharacterized protein n=1 Tax=Mycotypha africana TaxID=64632 RepID=UPI00230023D2|nr:uncharacterized protein BDF20DRAFT_868430 [Mycotypha africana]KAI8979244.1 hypothetical protein BDF20DRAFT_868430 [Mycotypha africana]
MRGATTVLKLLCTLLSLHYRAVLHKNQRTTISASSLEVHSRYTRTSKDWTSKAFQKGNRHKITLLGMRSLKKESLNH